MTQASRSIITVLLGVISLIFWGYFSSEYYKSLLMQFSYILWFLSLLLLSFCLELYLLWKQLKSLFLNGLIPQFIAKQRLRNVA